MMINATTVHVLAVVFLATLVRSAFGFGEALVAVPLLALRVPLTVAAPLAVLLSITVAGVVIVQDWHHVSARSAGWLVISTIPGIPIGLWLLTVSDERVTKTILAVVIIVFSAYSLLPCLPARTSKERRSWLIGIGFTAGVLGGAYGMNGPPLVIYGATRRWSPRQFRATLQAYFLPASLVGITGYWIAGLLTSDVARYYLACLPGALLAIVLGGSLNRRLSRRSFLRIVHVALVLIGLTLLIQAAPR